MVCTLRACPICPPSAATLCVETGGVWDPPSCGHYRCGAFPECDAVIPGCNCGPERNFRAGVGCVDDPACGRCAADSDCPPGSTCNTCPPDPSCPLCTVCGPPVCEPISCGFDEDCPPRSHCEGSSVCPPKVVCIWVILKSWFNITSALASRLRSTTIRIPSRSDSSRRSHIPMI